MAGSLTTIEQPVELDETGKAAVITTALALGVDASNAKAYSLGCGMELTPDPDRRLTLTGEKDALGLPRLKLDMRIADADFALYRQTLDGAGPPVAGLPKPACCGINCNHREDWLKKHGLGPSPSGHHPDERRSQTGRGRCRRPGAWHRQSLYRGQQRVSHLQRLQSHPEPARPDLAAGRSPEKGDGMKRRSFIAGVAAAGAAVAAGLYRFTDLFVKHYPPTPYDDVLARLVDREQAAKLGAKVPGTLRSPGMLAAQLRAGLAPAAWRRAANADVAAGRMVEVDGWLLPQSVALLSALAAKV